MCCSQWVGGVDEAAGKACVDKGMNDFKMQQLRRAVDAAAVQQALLMCSEKEVSGGSVNTVTHMQAPCNNF